MDNLEEVVLAELTKVYEGLTPREDKPDILDNQVTGNYGLNLRMDWTLAKSVDETDESLKRLMLSQAAFDIVDLIVNGDFDGPKNDALLRAMDGEVKRGQKCSSFVVNGMTFCTEAKEEMYDHTMFINFTSKFE